MHIKWQRCGFVSVGSA